MRGASREDPIRRRAICLAALPLVVCLGCSDSGTQVEEDPTVPREGRYGIYALDLSTDLVTLIHSSADPIFTSSLSLNSRGDTILFAEMVDCAEQSCTEIMAVGVDGNGLRRVTNNDHWDLYPVWSPDDSEIAFLSWRDTDLDIHLMNADGTSERLLFDSGTHDADLHWSGDKIVFTSECRIWSMNPDGTGATALSNPPRACEWGDANLPFGDYDPRMSLDGSEMVFERLEDDTSPHGDYNFFRMAWDGTDETRLTSTGHSQGLGSWSHSGSQIVFTVSAIDGLGEYRLYMMGRDGSNIRRIMPWYFPPEFLCHTAIFSRDDTSLYFVGEWWQ